MTNHHALLRHPHTGAPIIPLGHGKRGPIWPILGASDDDVTDGDAGDDGSVDSGDDAGDGDGADKLGDAGKQALDRMKEQRNAARTEAREFKALGYSPAEIKAILDARKAGDDQAPDPEALKAEGRREAEAKANERIIRSEIKAAASTKLSDPADALKFLDLTKFEVDDDGNVDEDEIAVAIDDLIKKKPYLAAQGGKRFQGSGDGGSRKETTPAQLTRADLAGMSPDEINTAKAEGRLNQLLGIK